MGKKLEKFILEKITEIGSDWWKIKLKEFHSLPYLSDDKLNIHFHGIVDDSYNENTYESSLITVNFDFLTYAYDSEGYLNNLDSAMQLCNIGQLREEDHREKPGLVFVKNKIVQAVDKTANKISASYDFKVFVDRTLALINDELDENSGIVDSDDYRKLMERFYNEIEADILSKYKYKYDASQRSSPPNYEKFPIKLNIEQLAALATYLCSVSELTKNQRLDLFSHFANVFEIWDKKKHMPVELKQIHSAYRKIKMKKHEGAGLKEILYRTHKIIDAIIAGKANDFLDIK